MIKKVKTQEEMIQEQNRQAEELRTNARNKVLQEVTAAIVDEYTPTKNQLILEHYEIGQGAFIGKYSQALNLAIKKDRSEIPSLARKLAEKTLYELEKQAGSVDYSKVKFNGDVIKAGKTEQPLFYLTTEMLADKTYKVYLEEPKKKEPDLREVPDSFQYRLTKQISNYTNRFHEKVKNGEITLLRSQHETVVFKMDTIRNFYGRLASEAYSRLAAAAIPEVGNLTDCSGIQVNYDEAKDELTLQGTVVGEHGTAEVYGIPVEYFGRKWFSMTDSQKSEKFYKVTGPIGTIKR